MIDGTSAGYLRRYAIRGHRPLHRPKSCKEFNRRSANSMRRRRRRDETCTAICTVHHVPGARRGLNPVLVLGLLRRTFFASVWFSGIAVLACRIWDRLGGALLDRSAAAVVDRLVGAAGGSGFACVLHGITRQLAMRICRSYRTSDWHRQR